MRKLYIGGNITALMLLLLISCNKDEVEPSFTSGLVNIAESVTNNNQFKVTLFASDTLFHGYNPIYFSLEDTDNDEAVSTAQLSLYPEMDMLTMRHSAPVEQADETANNHGLFEAAIVFIMPDTDEMKWRIKVNINTNEKEDSVWLSIPRVKSLEEPRIINFISAADSSTKYFVSLVQPAEPRVGINEFELAIHYKKSMMSFPADEQLSLSIDPQMPSMDHGSPNNVDPVHTANGHYTGKVNFTMTGWWRVFIDMQKNGEKISKDAYIDVTF